MLTSCAPQITTQKLSVDVTPKSQLSEFFSSYRYVKLQTTDNSVLYNPEKLKINDNFISLLAQDRIYLFNNKSGKMIGKIDHKGRGHGEYIEITNYDIYKDKIWILSAPQNSLFQFNKNGKYLKKIELDDFYHTFKFIDDNKVFLCPSCSNNGNYNFVLYDIASQKKLKEFDYFSVNQSTVWSSFNDFIGQDGDNLYVTHLYENTLFLLNEEEFYPLTDYKFNTKYQLSEDELSLKRYELTEYTRNKNIVKNLSLYCRFDNFSLLGFNLNDEEYGATYYLTKLNNDGTQKTVRFNIEVDKSFPYINKISCLYHDELVSLVQPYSIVYLENHYDIDNIFTKQGYTKEDNPVVFFYKIKK